MLCSSRDTRCVEHKGNFLVEDLVKMSIFISTATTAWIYMNIYGAMNAGDYRVICNCHIGKPLLALSERFRLILFFPDPEKISQYHNPAKYSLQFPCRYRKWIQLVSSLFHDLMFSLGSDQWIYATNISPAAIDGLRSPHLEALTSAFADSSPLRGESSRRVPWTYFWSRAAEGHLRRWRARCRSATYY